MTHTGRSVGRRWIAGATTLALACALALGAGAPRASAATAPMASPTPVLAYYYIWFNASSWNRAKQDYPLLGRYSSDQRSIMARHIRWAKQAGIDGFLVSWKSTPTMNRRLQTLIDVATKSRFRLGMIYEGLDFHRSPLPWERVRADLKLFADRYAKAAPFQLYDRPLVIWSGTWRFTPGEVAKVTAGLGDRLQILASERDREGYERLAGSVDGNAYYWSSADPLHTPGYKRKLKEMADAVHRHGGLWVAPAAPGFDARLIGGRRIVPRRSGETLREELDAATASAPDALGLISWNEYSENSHIEPSKRYGFESIRALADVLKAQAPTASDLDSSHSAPTGPRYGIPVLSGFLLLLFGGGVMMSRRRRADARVRKARLRSSPDGDDGHDRTRGTVHP